MRRGAFANLYFSPPCRLRAIFAPTLLQAALAPFSLAGSFCADARKRGHFAPLALRAAEFFCSLSLQGGRIFTYYSTSAAERQSYLPAKFVSPQNAPFRTQNAFAFFTEGGVLHSTRGRKKYFKPAPPVCGGRGGPFCPIHACCALRLRPSPRGEDFDLLRLQNAPLFAHLSHARYKTSFNGANHRGRPERLCRRVTYDDMTG